MYIKISYKIKSDISIKSIVINIFIFILHRYSFQHCT